MSDIIQPPAIMNVTTGATSFFSGTVIGWVVGVVAFIAILLTLFLVSKNFRKFMYGGVTASFLIGVSAISIFLFGKPASTGNYVPSLWLGGAVLFIVISIFIGGFVEKKKFIKKFEADWKINVEEKIK